ncbi:MAG: hypothetical protein JXR69_00570 [Candidatus Delongbacteria bacterium]|nr:hypothetical protein [Candidatus Delongbacteria bacterium]
MKRSLIILLVFIYAIISKAEFFDIDPNTEGVQLFSGGLSPISVEKQKEIEAIPRLNLPDKYKNSKVELPYTVDNSLQPYFRPVFSQQGGSCGQASGVGYLFTYEYNFSKGTSADVPENQFPTHYTYNFLNHGSGSWGSWYFDGWNIISSSGCPNVTTYGGMLWPSLDPDLMFKLWMNGYDKYQSGMENRVLE